MPSVTSATAADAMVRDVVTTTPDASLREALDLMMENHVSGLPVLDSRDAVAGVISASDILAVEQEHASQAEESLGSYFDPDTQRWESVRMAADDERLEDRAVSEVMATELISVSADTSLDDIARTMVKNDVHRVLVLDDRKRLLGIVAAFDFVRLLAAGR